MDTKHKKTLDRRLSIVEGHVRKVKKMVNSDAYCLDVVHQSQAIQSALRKVDQIILHSHLHSCVLGDIHKADSKKEKLVQELLGIFEKKAR